MQPIIYKNCETSEEIESILSLQSQNKASAISSSEKSKEGFVTIKHNKEILTSMNHPDPHILAFSDNQLIGYALVMHEQYRDQIPVLDSLFSNLGTIEYKGVPISDQAYFVMGQICIAKGYRGMGIFYNLYSHLAQNMSSDYDLCITSVDDTNPRSLMAHLKAGFKIVKSFEDNQYHKAWHILLLDWGD